MIHRIWALTLLLCLWASVASATTYYVRTDGNDGNPGTANTAGGAWRTIDKCADTVAADDVCRVQAGTYVETASPGVSGTSGHTVTLVSDGTVTTCGMSFSGKSYIRVIGFTMNPNASSCGGSPNPIVAMTGTNTGLEFWNNDIGHLVTGGGIGTTGGDPDRCTKCIIVGGSVHDIGSAGNCSMTAIPLLGDDNFVGYVDINTICYIGVNPAGSRGRYLNLNFSGLIQGGTAHPDNYYISVSTAGFSNALVEANYGIGTTTSTDNKYFHAENQSAVAWLDDIWRNNIAYNMGSGFFSLYVDNHAITRWRFYGNTIVNCQRANTDPQFENCGNFSNQAGNGLSASIYNNIFYNAWADVVTAPLVWSESFSPTITKDYNLGYSSLGSMTFNSQWTGQSHEQSNVNPNVVSVGTDFHLTAGSGSGANARGTGGPLTAAVGAGVTSAALTVTSGTGSFFIGSNAANLAQYGGALVPGDFIMVGSTAAQVASVSGDVLTLAAAISWSDGAAVYFGTSTTIDIGAYPYKSGGYTLSATYALVGGTAVTITPNDASLVRFAICYENGIPTTVDNASPYTCTVTSGATLDLRVYPKYASTTLYATATTASVPVITTASPLAQQTQNVAVSGVTISGTCTDTPCAWTSDIANAGACTGVTFTSTNDTTATIGGTPTTAGVCSFNATITDASLLTDTDAFTMTVNAAGTGTRLPGLRLRTP